MELPEVRKAVSRAARSAASPALVARARRLIEEPGTIYSLWARLWEEPGDLARRAVLGDALQMVGDPRGTLIASQLCAESTRSRRVAERLLQSNAVLWSGDLPSVGRCAGQRFAQGFLTDCRCRYEGPALAESLSNPAWRTVEHLQIDGRGGALPSLLHAMPSLRRLVLDFDEVLPHLVEMGPFDHIEAIGLDARWHFTRLLGTFPNATLWGMHWRGNFDEHLFGWIQGWARVRAFRVAHNFSCGRRAVWSAALTDALASPADAPEESSFYVGDVTETFVGDLVVLLRRGEKHVTVSWGPAQSPDALEETLRAIARSPFREARVTLSPARRRSDRRALDEIIGRADGLRALIVNDTG